MARIDFDAVAAGYDQGRAIPSDGLDAWRTALARYLPPPGARPVLDLGCGTGLFADLLARWFEVDVIGVDPSAGMLAEARRVRSGARIRYVQGRAEALPLGDRSCGAAWLSTMIHHVADLAACAAELARVLAPSAPVLVRSAFPGRLDGITLFRFFPEARAIAESFPTVEALAAVLAGAGYRLASLERVPQVTAPTLAAARGRVALRADSTLRPLRDEDFARGLAALDAAIAAGGWPEPIVDHLDLAVFTPVGAPAG